MVSTGDWSQEPLCVCVGSCPTFCNPRVGGLPSYSVHGISGRNTKVGCHFLLQGIFQTQGLNPRLLRLLHWQADPLPLSHQGSHPGCQQIPYLWMLKPLMDNDTVQRALVSMDKEPQQGGLTTSGLSTRHSTQRLIHTCLFHGVLLSLAQQNSTV